MRLGHLAVGLMAICLAVGSASAETYDGLWHGEMSCARLSFTKGPLKVTFDVAIKGVEATFSRKVWNRDRTAIVGTEEGAGQVAQTGLIKLSGVWSSSEAKPRYAYTASYSGQLSSGRGRLVGEQIWKFDGKTEKRSCSIDIRR
jgi:hypothetical protein